jgi:hypothetical protein
MRWRFLIWLAALIAVAAAAGLVADVAVAGIGAAATLAGVIAGFCELVAVVLGVSAWTAERRSSGTGRRAENAGSGASARSASETLVPATHGDDGKYVVDARGADGLQIGDGNTQHIIFGRATPGS